MKCAVVDTSTLVVRNIILADAVKDAPPVGCILVQLDREDVVPGDRYDETLATFEAAIVEPEGMPEDGWAIFRAERNRRLAACDWTQLPDSPVDRAAWATYRQRLRDLPQQTDNPFEPSWPEQPV